MIEIIRITLIFIIELCFLGVGYYLGSKREIKKDIEVWKGKVGDAIPFTIKDDLPVGPIKRPSAEKLNKEKDPLIVGERKAIKESLDQVPELVEGKKRAEELKKAGLL